MEKVALIKYELRDRNSGKLIDRFTRHHDRHIGVQNNEMAAMLVYQKNTEFFPHINLSFASRNLNSC